VLLQDVERRRVAAIPRGWSPSFLCTEPCRRRTHQGMILCSRVSWGWNTSLPWEHPTRGSCDLHILQRDTDHFWRKPQMLRCIRLFHQRILRSLVRHGYQRDGKIDRRNQSRRLACRGNTWIRINALKLNPVNVIWYTYSTALMSESWPMKVCEHFPDLKSHSLAVASQEPETKVFWLSCDKLLKKKWKLNSAHK